jgi:hypothetical protein
LPGQLTITDILGRIPFRSNRGMACPKCPIGAREAGHSNILWMELLTVWCCSTLGNRHRHFHSQTIPRPNIGATTKSGRGTQRARPLVTWRGCSVFPCSGLVRLCSNGGSKTQIFLKTDERSKPARFCFGDPITGICDDQADLWLLDGLLREDWIGSPHRMHGLLHS